MRNDYLSRGKRKDNGEWVQGYYVCVAGEVHVIITGKIDITTIATKGEITWERFEVLPETVGRCTGLTDKNGVLVFEHDIVTVNTYSYMEPEISAFGYIEMSQYGYGLRLPNLDGISKLVYLCEIQGSYTTEYEVHGNIIDTPELLENIT